MEVEQGQELGVEWQEEEALVQSVLVHGQLLFVALGQVGQEVEQP